MKKEQASTGKGRAKREDERERGKRDGESSVVCSEGGRGEREALREA